MTPAHRRNAVTDAWAIQAAHAPSNHAKSDPRWTPHEGHDSSTGKVFVLVVLQTHVVIMEQAASHPPHVQSNFLQHLDGFFLLELIGR